MTFEKWFDIFFSTYCEGVLSYDCCVEYSIINRKHYGIFVGMELSSLKPLHIQQCMKTALEYSSSRQRKVYYLLHRVFREAVVNDYVKENPVSKVKPPRKIKKHVKIFDAEQIEMLFDMETVYSRMLLLELWTGLRRGELLALHWDNIYPDYINVCQTLVNAKGGCQIRQTTKSGKDRVVPLSNESKRILNDIWRLDCSEGYLFCVSGSDKPISLKTYHDRYNAFFKQQQERHAELFYLTPHKLRHTFASYVLQGGADIETVRMLLGHSDITTTALYVHSGYKNMQDAVNRLDFT